MEIYNSIRGSLLGISAKMYNVGLFRIPMECFMYLIGLGSMSEENLYNLNRTLNEPAYCFEFEKLVDYYDLEEETYLGNQVMLGKLKESNDDLIRRSSQYGVHGDHQSPGHNVCVKVDGDELTSYFIDMGDFEFIEKGSLRRKKKSTKAKKGKKGKKGRKTGRKGRKGKTGRKGKKRKSRRLTMRYRH